MFKKIIRISLIIIILVFAISTYPLIQIAKDEMKKEARRNEK